MTVLSRLLLTAWWRAATPDRRSRPDPNLAAASTRRSWLAEQVVLVRPPPGTDQDRLFGGLGWRGREEGQVGEVRVVSSAVRLARARSSQSAAACGVRNSVPPPSSARRTAARPVRKASSGTWAYSARTWRA